MTDMVFGGQTPQEVYLGDVKLFPSDSGPQPPTSAPIGTWTWGTVSSVPDGGASAPESVSAVGAGGIYLSPKDTSGSDLTPALSAIPVGAVVTLKQGDVMVTATVKTAYFAMLKSLGVTYVSGGPWLLTSGNPVTIWAVAP